MVDIRDLVGWFPVQPKVDMTPRLSPGGWGQRVKESDRGWIERETLTVIDLKPAPVRPMTEEEFQAHINRGSD